MMDGRLGEDRSAGRYRFRVAGKFVAQIDAL
jgi:hypothetical protein